VNITIINQTGRDATRAFARFFAGTVFLIVLVSSLTAQTFPMAALDEETEKTAGLLRAFIQLSAGHSVEAGEADSTLSRYWTENILGHLTGKPGVTVMERGADFRLRVTVIELGKVVRIYTKLWNRDNSAAAVWTSDIDRTPLIESLIDTAGTGNVRQDMYESDSEDHPVVLEMGEPLSRTLHEKDTDWFSLTPHESGYIFVETRGAVDTVMELYENGELLVENDDGGGGNNARAGFVAVAGKTYTVKVYGYSEDDRGNYSIIANFAEIPDKHMEPNDSAEEAWQLSFEDEENEVTAFFLSKDDEDWYRVVIPKGGYFYLFTESEADTCLELFNGKKKKIAENDDFREGDLNARISLFLEEGVYYIKATAYESGPYTLSYGLHEVNKIDVWEDDDSKEKAKPIAVGEKQIHSFTTENDQDWVSFTVTQRGNYVIRAEGNENPELDTYISLYGEEELIDEDDDSGGNFAAQLKKRLLPGQYYIRVHVLEYPWGSYTLTVTQE
jgi:hypothetical protein